MTLEQRLTAFALAIKEKLATKAELGGAAFTGAISASNLTGNNTGDQTITLTGDVIGSGTGAITTTLARSGLSVAAARTNLATASTAAPVLLYESGREGVFVWSSANHSAHVTADPNQGLFIAPSSDTTGASGAWVRKFTGSASALWWGMAVGNTAGQNRSAFDAALNTLYAIRITGSSGYADGSIGLHIPAGIYNVDNSAGAIQPAHALEISGDFLGGWSGGGTQLSFNDGTNPGFQITIANSRARGKIRGLWLNGVGTTSNSTNHAIQTNNGITVEDVFCNQWSGNGVHIIGDVGSGQGNSNSFYLKNVNAQNCGWTVYCAGGDSNAGAGYFIGGIQNRFGTVFDNSFLGNVWVGGIAETVGLNPGFVTRCESGGHIYAVAYGQESWCSTNAPTGTASSNTGWLYLGDAAASSTQPTWTTGQTWYWSAPFASSPNNYNMYSQFTGMYIETNCNPVVLSPKSRLDPGYQGVPVWSANGQLHGGLMYGSGQNMHFNNHIELAGDVLAYGSGHSFGPQTGASDNNLWLDHTNYHSFLQARKWSGGSPTNVAYIDFASNQGIAYDAQIASWAYHSFQVQGAEVAQINYTGLNLPTGYSLSYNGAAVISGGLLTAAASPAFTGDVTKPTGSLATTIGANAVTYSKFQQVAASSLVGNPTGALANAQGITLASDHAFSGTTLQLGAFTGDVTKTSGSLATTVNGAPTATTGLLTTSTSGVGYRTGAGGAVTQLTGRTTGVTINKPCGAITLVSAAGSTTYSTFTVTNSTVAATDTIDVSQQSGANIYSVIVSNVAAGSFKLSVSAVSGTATEAPVINFTVQKGVSA